MPIGSIAYTFARADWAVVDPDRATASLVGDFPRPRAVRAVPRAVDGGMLGQVHRVRARMCTLPHGRPTGVPRSPFVRSRRLLHGRIGPWSTPTVPQPRWSGISLGQEPFGPCRAQSTVGCSAKCPVWVPECARCPMAGLKGCPEALWCDGVDFCTGGLGRA